MNLFNNNIFNSSNTIIVTEDKNKMLNNFSKERKIHLVNHRDYVGGRYSVLSETGMLPALFMNLNIKNFKKKILDFFEKDKKNIIVNNSLATSNLYLSKKINSIVFFNYSPKLKNLLYWCQQLIAESLGKKGKGLMPIISSAPRDHHSLLQLYLDGPKDKIFYIISSKSIHNYKINKDKNKKNFNYLKNKSLEKIVSAQKDAFIRVLTKNKIPFREIHINSFSESTIGELFAYFILETTIVGKLIGVNPYNQPAVEDVKVFTKKNLS
jgi:glucose-6-phosphate isomerase